MNTVQDVYNLERFVEILARIFAVPYEIIESSIARYYRAYKEEKGIDALSKWVNDGGDLSHVEIFSEHIEDIASVFKVNHIPYVIMNTMLGDNSPIATVVFRDKDKDIVEDIVLGYRSFISKKNKELDIYSFKSLMNESEIATASNLSMAEIYAFRREMREEDFMFCVGKDPDNQGKYQIFADSKQGLSRVLAGISYDFNAPNSNYKKEVEQYAAQFKKLDSLIDTNSFYIVDGADPKNFTYVNKNSYSIHSMVVTKERQPDGTLLDVVSDPAAKVFNDVKAKSLFKQAMLYKKPMIISEEEFYLVEGYRKNGQAIESKFFPTQCESLRCEWQSRKASLTHYPRKQTFMQREKLMGYVHMPQNFLKELAEQYPQIYIHYDGSMAFQKDEQILVDRYLYEKLKTLSPLKRAAFKMYIGGRSGDKLMDLSGKSENTYYIIDPKRPYRMLIIDNKSATYMKEGVEEERVLNTSDGYERFVVEKMDMFINPVGFNEIEMMAPGRDAFIEKAAGNELSNPAIEFLTQKEEKEREEFISQVCSESEPVSKEHEKARDDFLKMKLAAKILDRKLFREVQERHITKELNHEIDI